MTPVRITFQMRTPMVIPSTGKHLDALLSWAAVRRAEFHGHDDPWSAQHDIGLAKHVVGDHWCFMASVMQFDWAGERGQLHYIKRSKLEDYADAHMVGLLDRRPAFDAQRGLTKAGSYLLPVRWAERATAYAVVEDMDKVYMLLNWVTHIGKLHHKDMGAVASTAIEDDVRASDFWSMRNLPVGSPMAKRHAHGIGGLTAPYWKRENHVAVCAYVGENFEAKLANS